jgi:glutathione S-transferase
VVDNVRMNVQPKILGYLDRQITGKFLVGDAMTLADIAIVSNFIVYQYLGFEIDAGQYPKLARYLREIAATPAFQRALADEKPFADQMGLKRDFLSAA